MAPQSINPSAASAAAAERDGEERRRDDRRTRAESQIECAQISFAAKAHQHFHWLELRGRPLR
jgi:hypothetical protein